MTKKIARQIWILSGLNKINVSVRFYGGFSLTFIPHQTKLQIIFPNASDRFKSSRVWPSPIVSVIDKYRRMSRTWHADVNDKAAISFILWNIEITPFQQISSISFFISSSWLFSTIIYFVVFFCCFNLITFNNFFPFEFVTSLTVDR